METASEPPKSPPPSIYDPAATESVAPSYALLFVFNATSDEGAVPPFLFLFDATRGCRPLSMFFSYMLVICYMYATRGFWPHFLSFRRNEGSSASLVCHSFPFRRDEGAFASYAFLFVFDVMSNEGTLALHTRTLFFSMHHATKGLLPLRTVFFLFSTRRATRGLSPLILSLFVAYEEQKPRMLFYLFFFFLTRRRAVAALLRLSLL